MIIIYSNRIDQWLNWNVIQLILFSLSKNYFNLQFYSNETSMITDDVWEVPQFELNFMITYDYTES